MTCDDLARLDLPAAALRAALVCLTLAEEAQGEPFAVSAAVVAERSGLPPSTAGWALRQLRKRSLIAAEEEARGRRAGRYRLKRAAA